MHRKPQYFLALILVVVWTWSCSAHGESVSSFSSGDVDPDGTGSEIPYGGDGSAGDPGADARPLTGDGLAFPDSSGDLPNQVAADTWVNRGGDPNIGVDPLNYSFSYVSPLDHTMVKQIYMYNGGHAPLVISKIEFDPNGSSDFMLVGVPILPLTMASGKQGFVNVGFLEKEGGTGTLRIHSNDLDEPVVEVTFSSHLKAQLRNPPEACAGLTPSLLNFGTVVRGYSKVLSSQLTNCSPNAPLTLTNITRSQFFFFELTDEYQLVPQPTLPVTLAPGESTEISVEYKPKLAGPDTGYFILYTDDPAQPQLNLDLTAWGEAPPEEELGLTIKLSWDADLCDVDSHLIMPGGTLFDCDQDCHFGNPAPDWGTQGDWIDDPFLDVDDVDGYGPEHINISEPIPGTYTFVVHYYRDDFEFSESVPTSATIEVSSYGTLLGTYGPTLLDQTNRTWDAITFEWPSKNIVEVNNIHMLPASSVAACLPLPFP